MTKWLSMLEGLELCIRITLNLALLRMVCVATQLVESKVTPPVVYMTEVYDPYSRAGRRLRSKSI
jgi:hypothetical protein